MPQTSIAKRIIPPVLCLLAGVVAAVLDHALNSTVPFVVGLVMVALAWLTLGRNLLGGLFLYSCATSIVACIFVYG